MGWCIPLYLHPIILAYHYTCILLYLHTIMMYLYSLRSEIYVFFHIRLGQACLDQFFFVNTYIFLSQKVLLKFMKLYIYCFFLPVAYMKVQSNRSERYLVLYNCRETLPLTVCSGGVHGCPTWRIWDVLAAVRVSAVCYGLYHMQRRPTLSGAVQLEF